MRCFGCAFLVAALTVPAQASEWQEGGWTVSAGEGALLVYPTDAPDRLQFACMTDGSLAGSAVRIKYGGGTENWAYDSKAIAVVGVLWDIEDSLPGSRAVAASMYIHCLDEAFGDLLEIVADAAKNAPDPVAAAAARTDAAVAKLSAASANVQAAMAKAAPLFEPRPPVTAEEIQADMEEAMRPYRERTDALLAELEREAQKAWDDWRASRRESRDERHPLPITIPPQQGVR